MKFSARVHIGIAFALAALTATHAATLGDFSSDADIGAPKRAGSADGKFIYFNSERSGHMQIWRMKADGSEQTQITRDEWNNWFAHPSPDGKWLVFLSYESDINGHPENKDVILRLMSLDTGNVEVLAKLFGGQGTINVPSWSPDSKRLAFVSYQISR
jgi:TolB protein